MHHFVQTRLLSLSVEYAAVGFISSLSSPQLATATGSLLRIYNVAQSGPSGQVTTQPPSLYLCREIVLEAVVSGVEIIPSSNSTNKVVSPSRSDFDILALSFLDAKISLVKFNGASQDFTTLAAFFFEKDIYRTLKHSPPWFLPCLRKDHKNRCLAIPVFHDYLGVLWLKYGEDEEEDLSLVQHLTDMESIVIKYSDIDPRIGHVLDVTFLQDYYEPTVAILFEPQPTWTGRLCYQQDTKCIAWVTLDLEQRKFFLLNMNPGLPYNAFRLFSIPKPAGGLFVFSTNAITHLDQGGSKCSFALNPYFDKDSAFHSVHVTSKKSMARNLNMDNAEIVQLDDFTFLLNLHDGQLFTLRLKQEGRMINLMTLNTMGRGQQSNCLVRVNDRLIFSGTRLGAYSTLYYMKQKQQGITATTKGKASRRAEEEDDLDDALYGKKTVSSTGPALPQFAPSPHYAPSLESNPYFEIYVSYQLLNFPPIKDMVFAHDSSEKIEWVDKKPSPAHNLSVCSGQDDRGTLSAFQLSIQPKILTSFPLVSCEQIWSLPCHLQLSSDPSSLLFHKFLILTTSSSSMVLVTKEEEITELEVSDFFLEGKTISAGAFANTTLIAQVYSSGIRLINAKAEMVCGWVPEEENRQLIVYASIVDPYIVCIFDDGRFSLFAYNEKTYSLQMFLSSSDIAQLLTTKISTVSLFLSPNHPLLPPQSLILTTSVGSFLMIDIERRQLFCECADFHELPSLLLMEKKDKSQGNSSYSSHTITRVLLYKACSHETYLLVRNHHGDLFIYCLLANSSATSGQLPVRFTKLPLSSVLRSPSLESISNLPLERTFFSDSTQNDSLIPFDHIGSFSGIFVAGDRPHWLLFQTSSLLPSLLPMTMDGSVQCFSPYHSMTCDHGFVYINSAGFLRIALLPAGFSFTPGLLSNSILYRRTEFKRSVEFIAFHHESSTFSLATSLPVPFLLPTEDHPMGIPEESKEKEKEERLKGLHQGSLPMPFTEEYQIELVSTMSFHTIDKYSLQQYEEILSITTVSLESRETTSGRKLFVAVGTAYVRGEDRGTRGRVLLFEVIDVVPEPNRPDTNHKLKLIHEEEMKGPVSALAHTNGYLLVSTGSKIIFYSFADGESLNGVAFIEGQIFISSMVAIKNFILFGDLYKSLTFIAFQEDPPKIFVLGRDIEDLQVVSSEFSIKDNECAFIASDLDGNLFTVSYSPFDAKTMSGHRLIRKGDYHYGHTINKLLRVASTSSNVPVHFDMFGSSKGELGHVIPIGEKQYRRLYMIYQKACQAPQPFGKISPKYHRTMKSLSQADPNIRRNMLDGGFLLRFFLNLSQSKQKELAKSVGTHPDKIMNDFAEIQAISDI